jgi:hypothetical protein
MLLVKKICLRKGDALSANGSLRFNKTEISEQDCLLADTVTFPVKILLRAMLQ